MPGGVFKGIGERLGRAGGASATWLGSTPGLVATMALAMFALLAISAYVDGTPERIPFFGLYVGLGVLTLAAPVMLVWLHRRRQQRVIDKIRRIFTVASEQLAQGNDTAARRALASIRRWEQHWRLGDSVTYRAGYSVFVVGLTTLIAASRLFVLTFVGDLQPPGEQRPTDFAETFQYYAERPIALWALAFLAFSAGLMATTQLKDLKGAPWSTFYGDQLAAVLRAGRGLRAAPRGRKPSRTGIVSDRELLGLPPVFTAAELKRAWLTLVRELHPDRFPFADTSEKAAKDAALKRVNAARDRLAGQVVE